MAIIITNVMSADGEPTSTIFIIFLAPAIMVAINIVLLCYITAIAEKARIKIQEICAETSRQQPRLSFHLCYDRFYYRSSFSSSSVSHGSSQQYIEVIINPTGTPHEAARTGLSSFVATGGLTTAERLQELEKVKGLLQPHEYQAKREEILQEL
jgi:hypothetical protein